MNYSALRTMASNKITAFGSAMTLMRYTKGTFNATTGTYASSTLATYSVYGVVTEFREQDRGISTTITDQLKDNTLVESIRKTILLSTGSLTVVPDKNDLISAGGETYEILYVDQIKPAGTNIIYKLIVRK